MSTKLCLRAPGKLLLSGEYAVLKPGSQALGLSVDRYLYLEAQKAADWKIESELLEAPLIWEAQTELQKIAKQAPQALHLFIHCLSIAEKYFQGLAPMHFKVRSELQSDGIKLGLGSSAALSLAVLGALFVQQGENIQSEATRLRIFKLALIAHRTFQGNGSGADLATCLWGSVCHYAPPDFNAVPWHQELKTLINESQWPLLQVKRLNWPPEWIIAFGWTGQAASSKDFVNWFLDWEKYEPEAFELFLFESNSAQLALSNAIYEQDWKQCIQGIQRCRRVLQVLNDKLPVAPETDLLCQLALTAEQLGGSGKLSGAGGGDCGLALIPANQEKNLRESWHKLGIQALSLKLDFDGLCQIKSHE